MVIDPLIGNSRLDPAIRRNARFGDTAEMLARHYAHQIKERDQIGADRLRPSWSQT